MAQHSRWTHWKMQHGLVNRGRSGNPLEPRGFLAYVCYWVYFKWHEASSQILFEEKPGGGRVFYQNVGGSVGADGKVNRK